MTIFENGYFFEIPDKWLAEHDKQVRKDAISEISREIRVLYGNDYEKQVRKDTIDEMAQTIREIDADTTCMFNCPKADEPITCAICVLERAVEEMKGE